MCVRRKQQDTGEKSGELWLVSQTGLNPSGGKLFKIDGQMQVKT